MPLPDYMPMPLLIGGGDNNDEEDADAGEAEFIADNGSESYLT